MLVMLNCVKVRINFHETDRQCMCRKIWAFSLRFIPEMNNEHVLKDIFEGIKFGPGK